MVPRTAIPSSTRKAAAWTKKAAMAVSMRTRHRTANLTAPSPLLVGRSRQALHLTISRRASFLLIRHWSQRSICVVFHARPRDSELPPVG